VEYVSGEIAEVAKIRSTGCVGKTWFESAAGQTITQKKAGSKPAFSVERKD